MNLSNEAYEFIPYGKQKVTSHDIEEVVNVLKSSFLTQGTVVPEFEEAVAHTVEARFGIAVNSATSALHIACLALGLGPGDRLWTSPTTFVASANCARFCGAHVDFVDISPKSGLIDIQILDDKLKAAEKVGKLPKVLIPVHLAGSSCDMKEIRNLADRYGFSIIEDASHAIGGCYNKFPVGNCRYSDICVFSFHPVKIITTGEGGMATTNNEDLAQKMSQLRSHGITKNPSNFINITSDPWAYEQQYLGFNYRMTDIQAALGLSQLRRLREIVSARNSLLRNYIKLTEGLPLRFLEIPEDVYSSVHLGVVCLHHHSQELHRFVFDYLRASKIGVQVHYTPVHLQPYYQNLGFSHGQFPNAEFYAKNAFSLPLYPGLSEMQQIRIIDILSQALKQAL